ncbi:uncharacterized protein IUM83_09943 [Phytophthora cinnamomi]|uniref:uncharacterized protein n=1 Tax=Phytophthora cinnamomi TaxID=4785 RepID=UPI003559487C|nr:hypothetical protein IUM83_09943 [Phytophthora cinnamomi]
MKQRKATKSKKRKRNNLSSSTRLHQCKKAEILYLRKRVVELEEELQILKTRCKRLSDLQHRHDLNSAGATWEELAEANYQARLQSEEMNSSLKLRVANQFQMTGALSALIQQLAAQGIDTAFVQDPDSIGTDTAFEATGLSDVETLLLERDLTELDII